MDYNIIKALAKERAVPLKEICSKVGMSEVGLYRSFINNTLKVDILEKIANVLGVSPCYFFGSEPTPQQPAAKATQVVEVSASDKDQGTEYLRMALCSVQIGVNYCQADLIKRTLAVLNQKQGKFSVTDSVQIMHQWQAHWDNYFNQKQHIFRN
jgi:transcriptional regulator with XRE-family HTH domain